MQRYFDNYTVDRDGRRIGTALGVLSALFALLVMGGIFVIQSSLEKAKRAERVIPVEQTAQSTESSIRSIALFWQ